MNDIVKDASAEVPSRPREMPLVVDLDGTLLKSDLLFETFFSCPPSLRNARRLVEAFGKGKAALKLALAELSPVDYATLPYDPDVIDYIKAARAAGRTVILATASNERHAEGVCTHLGLFDGFLASDASRNLKGQTKADLLVERYGRGGFEYMGNDASDLKIWTVAGRAVAVRTAPAVLRRLSALGLPVTVLEPDQAGLAVWIRAIRVHQYAKNILLFVALLASHTFFDPGALLRVVVGFVAFSCSASAIYLINDLVDLGADRAHPTKRRRPLASGAILPGQAVVVSAGLLVTGLVLALAVSPAFAGVLVIYLGLTTAYSFSLKRKMIVDVITLASLYTIRVIAGAVAAGIVMSEWLLAFSMFIFMGLALIKRATELMMRVKLDLGDASNRNYKRGDETVVAAMAAASGFNALTVLSLYIASPAVQTNYSAPAFLWLVPPIILYWFLRALMLAYRGLLEDDPIVFALRDKVSRIALLLIGATVILATTVH